jgi:hypothetical protein
MTNENSAYIHFFNVILAKVKVKSEGLRSKEFSLLMEDLAVLL